MSHSFTQLTYHIVFATKHRRPLIDESIEPQLYAALEGIIRDQDGIPLEVNGMPDHVHVLARLSPTRAVSDVLRMLKATSSARTTETMPEFGWQNGYAAFTVSRSNVDAVRRYIRDQKRHHAKKSFMGEFRQLLELHGYDPAKAADLLGE